MLAANISHNHSRIDCCCCCRAEASAFEQSFTTARIHILITLLRPLCALGITLLLLLLPFFVPRGLLHTLSSDEGKKGFRRTTRMIGSCSNDVVLE
jgi:hypothetical protein